MTKGKWVRIALVAAGIALGAALSTLPQYTITLFDPNRHFRFVRFRGVVGLPQDLSANLDEGRTALDGMTRDEIAQYRIAKVRRFAQLGFFHPGYHPLARPHSKIYGPITSRERWLPVTPYYIANPYLPIVMAAAGHVTPLNMICQGAEITYHDGTITEAHQGSDAGCWLDALYRFPDHPGTIGVVMVNAWDAGFYYVHLDRARSENIQPSGDPANVVNGLFSQSSFFHVGRYGKNNISPEDRNGWIVLKDRNSRTRIRFKLWRKPPRSVEQAADLVYEAAVLPGGTGGTP